MAEPCWALSAATLAVAVGCCRALAAETTRDVVLFIRPGGRGALQDSSRSVRVGVRDLLSSPVRAWRRLPAWPDGRIELQASPRLIA